MPRRRVAAPPPRTVKKSASPQRASSPTAASNVPAPPAPSAPVMVQPQPPSLMAQMATTAGGVALGTAVGHTVAHSLTGLMDGGGSKDIEASPPPSKEPNLRNGGPCTMELQQFIECAQRENDLTLCEGFNDALRHCKIAHNLP